MEAAAGTFTRFMLGFVLFISLSFGIALAANTFASTKDQSAAAASAEQQMLRSAQ